MRRRPSGPGIGVALVATAWLAASCAAASPGGAHVADFDDDGLRVSLPAGWEAMPSSDVGIREGRLLFYVSNQALHADCPPERIETGCRLPVDALASGGVLLVWATSPCAGPGCALPDGDRRLIGGREAAAGARTGMCAPIGATEETVYAVSVSPQRVDWIVICAHSPGDEERAAVAAILDGVDWRTP